MKALIRDGVVVDLAAAVFPVHPAFVWVDGPEGVVAGCRYIDGQFVFPEKPGVRAKPDE